MKLRTTVITAAICALVVGAGATQLASAPTAAAQLSADLTGYGPWPFTYAQWFEARGVYVHYAKGPNGTVEFSYGGPEIQRMSYADFEEFVRLRLVGLTVVRAGPPFMKVADRAKSKVNDTWVRSIDYYSADGRVAHWRGVATKPVIGKWTIINAPDAPVKDGLPPLLFCTEFPGDPGYANPAERQVTETCATLDRAIYEIQGRRTGDVFGLMTGAKMPKFLDPISPPNWPDGQPLIADRAPHD